MAAGWGPLTSAAQRARGWTQTPEGARVAAEYLDIDPASAREPQLRARIETAIPHLTLLRRWHHQADLCAGKAGRVGDAVSELAYPLIELSRGHLVIVHDETELRRCTRAGVRGGWYDDLVIVDSALRHWPVTLRRTRADGVFGWLTGRLVADLELGQPGTVDLDDVRQHVIDVLQLHADYWDADGQLDARLHAMRRAPDLQQLIDGVETHDP